MRHTCLAFITIDYVLRIEKKNYPQVYLEECKYKTKKKKMPEFTDVGLESIVYIVLILNNCLYLHTKVGIAIAI